MADQKNTSEQAEGGFPNKTTGNQDPTSTTGDGHPPRPNEMSEHGDMTNETGMAGQKVGQTTGGGSGQDAAVGNRAGGASRGE